MTYKSDTDERKIKAEEIKCQIKQVWLQVVILIIICKHRIFLQALQSDYRPLDYNRYVFVYTNGQNYCCDTTDDSVPKPVLVNVTTNIEDKPEKNVVIGQKVKEYLQALPEVDYV